MSTIVFDCPQNETTASFNDVSKLLKSDPSVRIANAVEGRLFVVQTPNDHVDNVADAMKPTGWKIGYYSPKDPA
jgi:hypothetical protein